MTNNTTKTDDDDDDDNDNDDVYDNIDILQRTPASKYIFFLSERKKKINNCNNIETREWDEEILLLK